MSDAQWLLIVLALIYLSDCLIWLRKGGIAVVIPLHGKPMVCRPSSWAGNERGALAFATFLPARAVFVCDTSANGSFRKRDLDRRMEQALTDSRALRILTVALFIALFVIAPIVTWRFGFVRVGPLILMAFVIANAVTAFAFFRVHRRIDPGDSWHRWTHAIVMLVATPSAIRAVDQATRHALSDFDALAIAARLAGQDDPAVKAMLRELAHPTGGGEPDKRHESARRAGLEHIEEPPSRSGDADTYCPRCLSQYLAGPTACSDCGTALRLL